MVFTSVYEAAWCSFAELLGLVGERDLHHPGDVTRGSLDPDGMGGDQLEYINITTRAHTHKHTHTQAQCE